MSSQLDSKIVDFINGIDAIDEIGSSDPKIFINSLKTIDNIGPSNTSKGVIVDLLSFGETTLLRLYNLNDKHSFSRVQNKYFSHYRLHELTDELFRLEFFWTLRQKNISYSVLEGYLPGTSDFSIDAPYAKVDQIVSEIDQKYFKPIY